MQVGKSDNPYCYQLQGIALEDVAEEKDLGIIINSDLKVSNQCSQAYAKASKMIGVMNRSIVYKYSNRLLKFYKSQYSTVVLTVVRVMIAKYRKSGIWGYRSSLTPEPVELK